MKEVRISIEMCQKANDILQSLLAQGAWISTLRATFSHKGNVTPHTRGREFQLTVPSVASVQPPSLSTQGAGISTTAILRRMCWFCRSPREERGFQRKADWTDSLGHVTPRARGVDSNTAMPAPDIISASRSPCGR